MFSKGDRFRTWVKLYLNFKTDASTKLTFGIWALYAHQNKSGMPAKMYFVLHPNRDRANTTEKWLPEGSGLFYY